MSILASKIEEESRKIKSKIALLNVLITEDSPISQNVAKRFFMKAGIPEKNIVIAENGAEAVRLVRLGQRFDVIYMDELMPVMEGPEATLQIRKLEKSMRFSSIIFTCSSSYQGVFPGANVCLAKPLTLETVTAFLETVVASPKCFVDKIVSGVKPRAESMSAQIKFNLFSKILAEDDDVTLEMSLRL